MRSHRKKRKTTGLLIPSRIPHLPGSKMKPGDIKANAWLSNLALGTDSYPADRQRVLVEEMIDGHQFIMSRYYHRWKHRIILSDSRGYNMQGSDHPIAKNIMRWFRSLKGHDVELLHHAFGVYGGIKDNNRSGASVGPSSLVFQWVGDVRGTLGVYVVPPDFAVANGRLVHGFKTPACPVMLIDALFSHSCRTSRLGFGTTRFKAENSFRVPFAYWYNPEGYTPIGTAKHRMNLSKAGLHIDRAPGLVYRINFRGRRYVAQYVFSGMDSKYTPAVNGAQPLRSYNHDDPNDVWWKAHNSRQWPDSFLNSSASKDINKTLSKCLKTI
jgi:hypothetical protein